MRTLALLGLMALTIGARPWPTGPDGGSLASRFEPPEGHTRVAVTEGSFGAWLRALPLAPGRPDVKLHDGRKKANQSAHVAVLDIDAGRGDLQQCADAVMRLRAEYLWAAGRADEVCFRFTSGDPARWSSWRRGERPKVKGNRVSFARTAGPSKTYSEFRKYLRKVFTYAGTASLEKEIEKVDATKVEPGDVLIRGGFPGHAVIVLDVAEDATGLRRFLLGQSYMPAQDIHVLRGPEGSPWYVAKRAGPLRTPEWDFEYTDLRRFGAACP